MKHLLQKKNGLHSSENLENVNTEKKSNWTLWNESTFQYPSILWNLITKIVLDTLKAGGTSPAKRDLPTTDIFAHRTIIYKKKYVM